MSKNLKILTNGLVKENPVLRLVLGTCPTLAVTTAAINGIGMGLSATFVLVCSGIMVSLLRNIIPDKIRIPAYITIIASFVTLVQMIVKAYLPAIDEALGIFLPLIVVNCIILARAEMFASKNSVLPAALDGLGMGLGFTATLTLMGAIRELIGAGTIFSIPVTANILPPMLIMILPPGGFFVFGILVALSNHLASKKSGSKKQTKGCENGCEGCALCGALNGTDNDGSAGNDQVDTCSSFETKPNAEHIAAPLDDNTSAAALGHEINDKSTGNMKYDASNSNHSNNGAPAGKTGGEGRLSSKEDSKNQSDDLFNLSAGRAAPNAGPTKAESSTPENGQTVNAAGSDISAGKENAGKSNNIESLNGAEKDGLYSDGLDIESEEGQK